MRRQVPLVDRLEPRVFLAADLGQAPALAAQHNSPPDLTVRFRRPPKGTFIGGSVGRAVVAVANGPRGAAPAAASTVALYLSADAVLDDADRAVASAPVRRAVKAGRRAVVGFRAFTFPADLASGTYHVLARCDDAGSNAEADEANNVADGGTISLRAPVVDIVPLALERVLMRYFKGIPIEGGGTLWIRNAGNVDFDGPVTGTILVRYPKPYDTGDPRRITFTEHVSIKRGGRAKIHLSIEPPRLLLEYTYTVTADAPTDPSPGQEVSATAKTVWR